jgi:PAS domain S-box-containing protein
MLAAGSAECCSDAVPWSSPKSVRASAASKESRAQNDPAAVAAEARALSERFDLKARIYETALSNTVDFNYVFNLEGRFIYINRPLLELWCKTAEEALGKNFFELGYPPDLAAKLQRQIQEVIATKKALRDETPYTSVKGTRAYEYIFVPAFDADGQVEAVTGSTRDITERKEAEEKLREADRRKDEFLAMLAHELRNPLASVSSAVTLLKESSDQGSRAWAADVIGRQSAQLARLVDDLLDVSRITRGRIELRREMFDAARVIESAVEAVAPLVAQRDHTLLTTVPRGVLWLEADPTRIEQVVLNLLTNAAKYTPPHGHIMLEASHDEKAAAGQGEVVIAVRDNGIGIPPEQIESMFELFTQGERSPARSEGGLGIGLTVVRALCELHGGSIEAASEGPGTGTTFTVRLPAAADVFAPIPAPESTVTPGEGAGRRLLIVDDNRDTATGLSRLLARRGYEVHLAHHGVEALEMAVRFKPRFILLDIGLPGMDGYEVATRLRAEASSADALIVAISGYGQEEDRTRSRAAGFDHHLVKPVDFEALRDILLNHG